MSFLLRLLKVFLLSWLGRSRGILEPSVISLRVWPNDLDLNIHVNNGRYLSLMDLGRLDLMMRAGAIKLWLGRGLQPLVALSMVRHFKALRLFQPFTLTTRLLGWDEKWVYFEQRYDSAGQLYCLGYVKGLMAGPQGPVPTPELFGILGLKLESPALPAHVLDWLKAERGAIDHLKSHA